MLVNRFQPVSQKCFYLKKWHVIQNLLSRRVRLLPLVTAKKNYAGLLSIKTQRSDHRKFRYDHLYGRSINDSFHEIGSGHFTNPGL